MTAALTEPDTDPDVSGRAGRLRALGEALRALRDRTRIGVSATATQMGIAPMTYRRLEQGRPVWAQTLLAVDEHLGVAPGTVARALDDDTELADLLRRLNVPRGVAIRHHPDTGTEILDEHGKPRPWRAGDVRLLGELAEMVAPFRGVPAIDELLEALKAAAPVLVVPPNLDAIRAAMDVVAPDLPIGYEQRDDEE